MAMFDGEIDRSSERAMKKSRFEYVALSLLLLLVTAASGCQKLTPQQMALKQLESARKDAREGNASRAIIEYRRAIQSDSKLAVAHFELGKLYESNNDLLNAYRQLSMAVQLDGSSLPARTQLAQLLLADRNYDAAKKQADAILVQRHDDPDGLLISAESLEGIKHNADARVTLLRLLQLQPNNGRAWVLMGGLQLQQGQFQDGVDSLRRGFQDDTTQITAAGVLASLLSQQGKNAEAETLIRQAAAKNPENVHAQYLLAQFLETKKRL